MKFFVIQIPLPLGGFFFRKQTYGEQRRTIDTLERARRRSKYNGERLRDIRQNGQARECARRRKHWVSPPQTAA